ncbi:MAG: hypothetical protein K2M67_00975, partial [Muribaculaceae bacterium]|nr:hypothetical protein [Muribaculaceae bacterium]
MNKRIYSLAASAFALSALTFSSFAGSPSDADSTASNLSFPEHRQQQKLVESTRIVYIDGE